MFEYLIPENVKTRFEFFPGLGWKELFITLIGGIFGTIVFFILSMFVGHPARLLVIPIITLFGYMFSKPDPRTGMSFLDLLQNFRQFKTRTKKYYYVFGSGRRNG